MTRIVGIDAARTLAIVGMFLLHAIPATQLHAIPVIGFAVADNRPQLLFAVLDGISLGLISLDSSTAGRSRARRDISIRAVLLIALGLFLTTLNSGVIVILDYYGFYFLLVLPALFLPRHLVLGIGVALMFIGPVLVRWFNTSVDMFAAHAVLQLPLTWLLGGQYPAAIWVAYVLLGLWVTRLGFDNPRAIILRAATAAAVAVAALSVAYLGPVLPVVAIEVMLSLGAGAAACALVWGLILAIPSSGASRITRVFTAMGAMPCSVYVAHVLLISLIVQGVGLAGFQSWQSFAIILAICAVGAGIYSLFVRRGPLEAWARWMCSRPRVTATVPS